MSDELPDWMKPGATVAMVESVGRRKTLRQRVVKSIGKRYIVLDNGDRFDMKRGGLSRYVGSWGAHQRLVAPDDPEVVALVDAVRRAATARRLEKLLYAWEASGDEKTLREAIDALSKHLPSDGAA